MSDPVIIHQRWGTTSRPLDITGWEIMEWQENGNQPKRMLIDPGGNKYLDYLGKDGKHDIIKYVKSAEYKEQEKESKLQEKEESPEKILYDFVQELGIEFCCDQFANNACIYKNEYYDINSREIKAEIASKYFETKDSVFSDTVWAKFINVVSNKCVLNQKYFPLRCHTEGDRIYYDTGFSVWVFEKDTAVGYTKEASPIIFRRYNHQLKADIQPTDKSSKELIEEIISVFNIPDFRPEVIPPLFCSNHPNPIYLFSGDPGAAKSTFSLFIKKLVDPDQVDKLSMPGDKSISEFGMHRQHFYLLLYDNVRSFSQLQSDELCRMVTGGTSISRRLYTNGELFISKGLPRIVVNGLRPEPSSFNDLLDRTLLSDMMRITKSIPEKLVWDKIDTLLPYLRYACLRDMSNALILAYDQEFPKLPRMSEYCLIAESLNCLWGGDLGTFVNWFNKKMDVAHASGMDDPLAVVLLAYLEANSLEVKGGLTLTTSDWRVKLIEWADEREVRRDSYGNEYKSNDYMRPGYHLSVNEKDFPRNAVWLGRRFRDLAPLLHTLGYSIKVVRSSKENFVEIKKL